MLLLASGTPRSSPGDFYVLLSSAATYVQAMSDDPIQLADGQMPSQLMPVPPGGPAAASTLGPPFPATIFEVPSSARFAAQLTGLADKK